MVNSKKTTQRNLSADLVIIGDGVRALRGRSPVPLELLKDSTTNFTS